MLSGNARGGEDKKVTTLQLSSDVDSSVDGSTLAVDSRTKRRIVQQSQPMLRAIERTLVACVQEQPLVDDQTALRALVSAIRLDVDASETVAFVIAKLALAAVELGAAEKEWRDALRCIYTNIRNQSDLVPGEYSYLIYTSSLLAKESLP